MPPANRKNPQRVKSSESLYSLREFLSEFPNDEACLEYLWRERHSPDGSHAHCPKCDQEREFKRYKTKQQRQSWTPFTTSGVRLQYGLGITQLGDWVGHDGSMLGYSDMVFYLPSEQAAVVEVKGLLLA